MKGYVTIYTLDHSFHADLIRTTLASADIPVHLDNHLIVQMDWLLSNAVGNIKVQVPEENAEEAISIIAGMPEFQHKGKNETIEEGGCLNCGHLMTEEEDTCKACGWSWLDRLEDMEQTSEQV